MIDVPYKPTLHQAILRECNSVKITWSPPLSQALGDPVTNYLAQIRKVGSKKPWINCTSFEMVLSTSCLFTHLKKRTEYEVRVMAKNKLGYSLPSEVSKVSTKEAGILCYTDSLDSNRTNCYNHNESPIKKYFNLIITSSLVRYELRTHFFLSHLNR